MALDHNQTMWTCHSRRARTRLRPRPCAGGREGGYTYLLVLFLVAGLGLMAAQVGVVWQQAVQREREGELLAVGVEMARALASYKRVGPQQVYPAQLADLLEDKRFPNPVRHLRRIYRDPFSGQPRWGQVVQGGQIMGIYSLASGVPIRSHGLPKELGDVTEGASSYTEWVFRPVDEGAGEAAPGAGGGPVAGSRGAAPGGL
jgi:type II secretory pathway pseudopilin PulG